MTVCKECGSDKVQTLYWVAINTENILGMALSETQDKQDNWCPNCELNCEVENK